MITIDPTHLSQPLLTEIARELSDIALDYKREYIGPVRLACFTALIDVQYEIEAHEQEEKLRNKQEAEREATSIAFAAESPPLAEPEDPSLNGPTLLFLQANARMKKDFEEKVEVFEKSYNEEEAFVNSPEYDELETSHDEEVRIEPLTREEEAALAKFEF